MIEYRLTPWDTKAFGFKTAEIMHIGQPESADQLRDSLLSTEKELEDQCVRFVYTRIDASRFELRSLLQERGFYFAESSQVISRNKVQRFQKLKLPKLDLAIAQPEELELVRELVKDSFFFGRFHEDIHIPTDSAKKRYYHWIDDLVDQQATILVAKVNDHVVGLNIQKQSSETKKSELILSGCASGNELYVMSLWNEIMDYNRIIGMTTIRTVISASNTKVSNIYAHFGFKVEKTLFGFHKMLK